MSEDGLGCVQNHSEEIMSCVNASVPDIFNLSEKRHSNIHLLIFNQENCRLVKQKQIKILHVI